MRYINLGDAGIRCSALGFGCANLMGRVSRRQSLGALAAAYDRGITVFDTARSYGWGDSEAVVGEFACGRRDRLVLITKLGILPPPRNRLRQFLKPVVRSLLGLAARYRVQTVTTAIRTQIRQRVSPQLQRCFDIDSARASLHTSLKALRTDFVDVLFLHAPVYEQIADGKVIGFLSEVIHAGKARAIGVSTNIHDTNRILEAFPSLQVVQFENNLLNCHLDALRRKDQIGVLTNCPFGSRSLVDRLHRLAIAAPDKVAQWAEETGIDIRSSEGIGNLLLTYALAANSAGVVICGMHQAEHIARNAAVAAAEPPTHAAFWRAIHDIRETITRMNLENGT
jgi:aryl-alcohol dehydrogenase-like predicted oxidoreductase